MEELLTLPRVRLLAEADDYWNAPRSQLTFTKVAGGKLHDARIVCLYLQLVSTG